MTGDGIHVRVAVLRRAFGCVLAGWLCLACSSGRGGGGDVKAPSVPTGITATVLSTTAIRVSWAAATDDTGVAGYRLSCGGVSENDGQATSYEDTGLTPGKTYCYTVLAYDAAGNESARSEPACVTTPASGNVLSVAKAGTGSGTITSTPAGISCGVDCSEVYASGMSVTLTAAAAAGSTFGSWTGCDSVSATSCTVTMAADRNVTAAFDTASLLMVKGAYTFYIDVDPLCGWPTTSFFWPVSVTVTSLVQGTTAGWMLFPPTPSVPANRWAISVTPTASELLPAQGSPGPVAAAYNLVVDGGRWEGGPATRAPLDGRGEITSGTATGATLHVVLSGSDTQWECRSDARWSLRVRWADSD